MKNPYFVMLYNQKNTKLIPLMDDGFVPELAMFKTVDEAIKSAENTIFGKEFGYEIYKEGEGV